MKSNGYGVVKYGLNMPNTSILCRLCACKVIPFTLSQGLILWSLGHPSCLRVLEQIQKARPNAKYHCMETLAI